MKKVEAIIQPCMLDAVKEALKRIGVDGIVCAQVRSYGRQEAQVELYRGNEFIQELLPKIKLEMVVPGGRADEVIRTLVAAARTGKIGDGKVFVSDIADAIRIRNDDRGEGAL